MTLTDSLTDTLTDTLTGTTTDTASAVTRDVEHDIEVAAAPDAVFAVLADVSTWPSILPPTVHAEQLTSDGRHEHVRIVARAGDGVRSWESLRTIDHAERSIAFRQVHFADPIAHMEGRWWVRGNDVGGSTITLGHRYAAADPDRQD